MDTKDIIRELIVERDRINEVIKILQSESGAIAKAVLVKRVGKRKKMSAAARKRISEAQKARWAKAKKA